MTLHVCAECGTAYLAAPQCPHCGGGVYRFDWEEDDMPKATVEGGGSVYADNAAAEITRITEDAVPEPQPKPKAAAKPRTPKPAAEDDDK